MKKLIACLQLMRPANIVTSFADILVGFSVILVSEPYLQGLHGMPVWCMLGLLLLSTAGLYGGGVVMNDVCDAELDTVERPERPIPSGRISKSAASRLGIILLLLGIIAAFCVTWISGLIALCIAILALVYDAFTKKLLWLGPFNMALCRAFNLLLGISMVAGMLSDYWLLFFIHLFYISAVTLISKGEVNGGDKTLLLTALICYVIAIGFVLMLVTTPHFHIVQTLPFLAVFAYLIFSSLLKALKSLEPLIVRRAVKFGILSLIILDAAIAAGYSGWIYGLLMLLLLPLSMILGKKFAVT